jgi:hypothetical protein
MITLSSMITTHKKLYLFMIKVRRIYKILCMCLLSRYMKARSQRKRIVLQRFKR